jgi:hypothetical protein
LIKEKRVVSIAILQSLGYGDSCDTAHDCLYLARAAWGSELP